VVMTTDAGLDPSGVEVNALGALASAAADAPLPQVSAPWGYLASPGMPAKIEAFAGIDAPEKRFWSGVINVGAVYVDGAYMLRMGFNRDHNRGSYQWGIRSLAVVENFSDPAFTKAHPSPEGRFVNAQGQVSQMFSLFYGPRVQTPA